MSKWIALAAVLIAAPAIAQPHPTETSSPTAQRDQPDEDAEGTATSSSIVGTIVPGMVIATGLAMNLNSGRRVVEVGLLAGIPGPALGQWYAGKWLTPGLGARVIGGSMVIYGLENLDNCLLTESSSCSTARASFVVGGLLYVAGAVHDIATAGRSVRERRAPRLAVAPAILTGSKANGPGVVVSGAF